MPLAQTVDTLDSIPEAARGAYVQKDGKFVLDFEVPDVAGLKNTVAATRKERDEALAREKAWQQVGKTPAEIAEMVEAARTKEEAAAIKAGKFDEVLATHLGKAKQEKDEAVSKATKERDSALGVAKAAIVNTSLATALSKEKATVTGMAALPRLIGDRVRIEFDDAGQAKATIFEADGKTPMVGTGQGGLATFDDLVQETKKQFPDLFEGAGSGSGTDPKGQRLNAGGKILTRKDFAALDPATQMAKMKDGFKVVD